MDQERTTLTFGFSMSCPYFLHNFHPREANKAQKHKRLLKRKIKDKRRRKNATYPQCNHEFIAADQLFCSDSTDFGFRIPEKEEKGQLSGLDKVSVLVVGGRKVHFEKINTSFEMCLFARIHIITLVKK